MANNHHIFSVNDEVEIYVDGSNFWVSAKILEVQEQEQLYKVAYRNIPPAAAAAARRRRSQNDVETRIKWNDYIIRPEQPRFVIEGRGGGGVPELVLTPRFVDGEKVEYLVAGNNWICATIAVGNGEEEEENMYDCNVKRDNDGEIVQVPKVDVRRRMVWRASDGLWLYLD